MCLFLSFIYFILNRKEEITVQRGIVCIQKREAKYFLKIPLVSTRDFPQRRGAALLPVRTSPRVQPPGPQHPSKAPLSARPAGRLHRPDREP